MKLSFSLLGLFLLEMTGIIGILLFQELTTTDENDYYLLKEVTEAAMIDAIDINYYRDHGGDLRIVKEKFVENFTRRYVESTLLTSSYKILFYDIIETPPKVSIIVDTGIGKYAIFDSESNHYATVGNSLTSILEYVNKKTSSTSSFVGGVNYPNPYEEKEYTKDYYLITNESQDGMCETTIALKLPEELNAENIKEDDNVKSSKVEMSDLNYALLKKDIDYYVDSSTPAYSVDYNMFPENLSYMNNYDDMFTKKTLSYYNNNCYKIDNNGKEVSCNSDEKGKNFTGSNDKYDYWVRITLSSSDINDGDNSDICFYKYKVTWNYSEYKYK